METHTLTIKRLVTPPGRDSAGGQIRNYTVAARGSLPRTVKGRAELLTAKEKMDHGVRGERQGWKFLIPTNPQITLEDRIEFDYAEGQPQEVKVLAASHARSHNAKFWKVIGEQDTTEV